MQGDGHPQNCCGEFFGALRSIVVTLKKQTTRMTNAALQVLNRVLVRGSVRTVHEACIPLSKEARSVQSGPEWDCRRASELMIRRTSIATLVMVVCKGL